MNDGDINEYSLNSYCFLFYKNEIIFKEDKDCYELFLINEVEKFGIGDSEIVYISTIDNKDYYAVSISVSIYSKDDFQGYFSKELREMYGEIDEKIYFLALRALHFINWISKNKYCGCCGNQVQIEAKKTYIECSNCGHIMYSFINPCIIVAVLREGKILLARSPHFSSNMYSLISGFIEPGEFIETAVEREVKEEVGIRIKNIKYFGSHPWPFSNSLMERLLPDTPSIYSIHS